MRATFADRRHGWLASVDPAGPAEWLVRTSDGGKTWTGSPRVDDAGSPGIVTFVTRRHGWGYGRFFQTFMHETTNGGRSWRKNVIPLTGFDPQNAFAATPAFFKRRGVVPVFFRWSKEIAVAFYKTTPNGSRWSFQSLLRHLGPPDRDDTGLEPQRTVGFANESTWWIVGAGPSMFVTSDAGRHWHKRRMLGIPPHASFRFQTLIPLSSRTAFLTSSAGSEGAAIYLTHDGGHQWRRMTLPR